MKPIHIRMGASALIILGIIIAVLGARKTITLNIDGSSRSLQTFALTAGQALRAAGLQLAPQDSLSPGTSVWLRNGDTIQLDHASLVFIQAGRQVKSLITAERTPARILANAGLDLGAEDVLLLDGEVIEPGQPLDAAPAYRLQILRSVSLSVNDSRYTSTAPSLAHALWDQNTILRSGDDLSLPALTRLSATFGSDRGSLEAALSSSRQVTISTTAGDVAFRTAAVTVGEALAEAGLSLQGLDFSQPSPQENLPADGSIRLVRVEERVTVEQAPLPFETEYQPDPNSDLDSRSILQAGEYGLSSTRVRARYEDGLEVSRTSEASWISRQPLNRIVGYGTRVVMHTATASDGTTVQYWRSLQMWATSYRPRETSNRTASGMPLQKGVCAIDRSLIPFYTQMYIPGYGNCVAGDVGGGVIGRWIDLGYSDSDYQSWHQWVTVYFLWPAPENIVPMIP